MLKIYNTLTRRIEDFKPLESDKIGIYTCGPTVYREVHIGNFRTYIGADILRRVLIYNGFRVVHIKNITDVGHMRRTLDNDEQIDPIVQEAIDSGKTPQEIARHFTDLYLKDEKKLNILPATHYPKASEHIKEMIVIIKILIDKKLAYEVHSAGSGSSMDGNVYFDVKKFKNYGKLSGNTLDKMENLLEAVRVSVETDKKDSADFALWKKADEDRFMKWESPWGMGFPGWHIECSAMSIKYLGESFDIHTGGEDLIFPHHEDEIAQSEGATGVKFANYWVHGGYLLIDEEKMSRSKGNIYTIAELNKKGYEPLAFRYLTLMTHYRNKMNFTFEALEGAQTALNNLREIVSKFKITKTKIGCAEYEERFLDAISDDLNIPKALGIVWELIKSDYPDSAKTASLFKFDEVLGLELENAKEFLRNKKEEKIPDEIQKLIEERNELRKKKRYLLADQWRHKIRKKGYSVEDLPTRLDSAKRAGKAGKKGGGTVVKKI